MFLRLSAVVKSLLAPSVPSSGVPFGGRLCQQKVIIISSLYGLLSSVIKTLAIVA